MKVLSVRDMRRVEELAVERGMDWLRLMENAGSAAAKWIRDRCPVAGRAAVVLCGQGNNGGDGFVIARRLLVEGARVTVVLMSGRPGTEQAREMLARVEPLDVRVCSLETEPFLAADAVQEADVLVDAVYGLGFAGELPDYMRALLRTANRSGAFRVAADVPSGVNADTGDCDADAFRADATVTFTAMKPGLLSGRAAGHCGEVTVVPIGIDEELLAPFHSAQVVIDGEMVRACLPPRAADSHKGLYGRVLCIGGSVGMAGAMTLCVNGALRGGVGLAEAAVPESVYPILSAAAPEAVFLPLPQSGSGTLTPQSAPRLRQAQARASAVVLGCGLGRSPEAEALVWDVLEGGEAPLVLDADGINAAAAHIDRLRAAAAARPLVLTPHPGEMARLLGVTAEQTRDGRAELARRFADALGVTLVLKGHQTVVAAPDRAVLLNFTGNPGMATGGSGDVLAGLLGGLLAQGLEPYRAAMCAVWLHGSAGDRAAARLSQRAMLPRDLLDELGGVLLSLE